MEQRALFCVEDIFSVRGRPYLCIVGDVIEGVVNQDDLVGQCLTAPHIVGRAIAKLESASLATGGRKPVLCIHYESESELDELKALDWSESYIETLKPNAD